MKYVFLIIAIGTVLYLSLLGLRGLCEPDEGRYAEISREMIEKKDFLQPRLNYIKHFHKPPLAYWLVVSSFYMFGMNEFTARFPVAVLAIGGLVITFFFALLVGRNRKCAFVSAMVMATSFQYFVWSQVLSSDMIFSFFVYLSLFGFWSCYRGHKNAIYVFYLGMAFAFMVKGPVAVIIPFLIIIVYAWWAKEWGLFRQIKLLPGVILFLILVSPWFICVCLKNPGLFRYFLFNQSLGRFLTTTHGREGNVLYFVPILLIGFLPWLWFLPGALKKLRPTKRTDKPLLFLFVWAAVPVLFFSLSGSKLPGYILPIYPALAILVGTYIYEKGYFRSFVILCISASIVYLAGTAFLPKIEDRLDSNLSIRRIAQYIKEQSLPEDKIVNFRCFLQGLPFYLEKRVILMEEEREIQFEENMDLHKDYMFSSIDEFPELVREDERIWCFSTVEDYEELQEKAPLALKKLWQASRYVLVSNYEE